MPRRGFVAGHQQALHDLSPDHMLFHDLGDIGFLSGPIPHSFGIDDDAGAVFAVIETEENVIAWAQVGVAGYVPSTAALEELTTLLRDISDEKNPLLVAPLSVTLLLIFTKLAPLTE